MSFRFSLSEWFAHQVKKKRCRGQCATLHLLQRDLLYLCLTILTSHINISINILFFVKVCIRFWGFQKEIEKTIGLWGCLLQSRLISPAPRPLGSLPMNRCTTWGSRSSSQPDQPDKYLCDDNNVKLAKIMVIMNVVLLYTVMCPKC